MLLLALGVAIFGLHTRLARLETDAGINAAVGTAVSRRHDDVSYVLLAGRPVSHKNRYDRSRQMHVVAPGTKKCRRCRPPEVEDGVMVVEEVEVDGEDEDGEL
jgi:hypothetical protein